MQCAKCKSDMPKKAKFCPECGAAVPSDTRINVKQDIGKVKENVIDTVLGEQAQIGGQRQYSDNFLVGDIADSSNIVIGKNNDVIVTQGASAEEIAKAFSILLQVVKAKPESPEKTMAQTAVMGLEEEAGKGEQADESKVEKWFSFLAQMAPDIRDVAVDTFTNPIKGISTVFKKVAERAKAEKGK